MSLIESSLVPERGPICHAASLVLFGAARAAVSHEKGRRPAQGQSPSVATYRTHHLWRPGAARALASLLSLCGIFLGGGGGDFKIFFSGRIGVRGAIRVRVCTRLDGARTGREEGVGNFITA